jgi:uncharacterized protein (TIGR03790 family)
MTLDARASLAPEEILVIANRQAPDSVALARHYMGERGVPEENLVQLWVEDKETISRNDYEQRVVVPVQKFLRDNKGQKNIRCLLVMYGVPLRVGAVPVTEAEEKALMRLTQRRDELRELLDLAGLQEETDDITQQLEDIGQQITLEKRRRDTSASLDSELALVMAGEYSLSMWIPNPHFISFQGEPNLPVGRDHVLMVSRLDGPGPDIVKRIIRDSIETEKKGLLGWAYFDARWPMPEKEPRSGYRFYDYSIHLAARYLEQYDIMPVTLEETDKLFQPGDCPEAALYAGWYSLGRYIPAFEWQTGAVGYHIASQECQSLKRGEYWCKRMLEEGVAATLGPVGEPYVQAFPPPEIFFRLLTDGRLSLAEVFLLTNPFWSWKMVLLGDPLYRPFKIRD